MQGNALIVQSGGPTAVINQTLAGVVAGSQQNRAIKKIYGAYHGLHGLLHENFLDLSTTQKNNWDIIAISPGAALGSARLKPKPTDMERIFSIFQAHNIKFLFYIGGNDSAQASQLIREAAHARQYDIRMLHLPKTIDNDLLETDHCPGYGSVAKVVSHIIAGDDLDNRSFFNSIKINVVMGRHAGWIAAATALAKLGHIDVDAHDALGPHLIYVPEIAFSEEKFISDVQTTYDKIGRATIVVAEGVADRIDHNRFAGESDEFGNSMLSSSGKLGDYLAEKVKKHIKYNEALGKLRCRSDTLGYVQRSFAGMASAIDQKEAYDVGLSAAKAISEGHTDKMLALRRLSNSPYRCETFLCDLSLVAQKTKLVPREFLNEAGNGVSPLFFEYALPLVGDLPELHTLCLERLEKKLPPFHREP